MLLGIGQVFIIYCSSRQEKKKQTSIPANKVGLPTLQIPCGTTKSNMQNLDLCRFLVNKANEMNNHHEIKIVMDPPPRLLLRDACCFSVDGPSKDIICHNAYNLIKKIQLEAQRQNPLGLDVKNLMVITNTAKYVELEKLPAFILALAKFTGTSKAKTFVDMINNVSPNVYVPEEVGTEEDNDNEPVNTLSTMFAELRPGCRMRTTDEVHPRVSAVDLVMVVAEQNRHAATQTVQAKIPNCPKFR
jgi:hypothetical protein